jgi:hypothetical protein
MLDPAALRTAYRDSITTLHDNVVHRMSVNESMAAESCYLYRDGW